jgi:GMP reductase
MRIEDEIKLDFRDVLIRPKRSTLSSRKEVDLCRTYKFKHSGREWTGIPIMAANMDGVGTMKMAETLHQHKMFTCLVKGYNEDDFQDIVWKTDGKNFAVSTGTSDADFQKLRRILYTYPEIGFICIDVANGYQERFADYVQKVREAFPKYTIIAGNVVTADMTQELILRGADIVKVGIGPGSVCTTRIQTGVGYPQLSAIIECADAAHGLGAHIIADGGCTCPGDVAKAFGAGADFVMLGGMLAGHDEGGGKIVDVVYKSTEQNVMVIGEQPGEDSLLMPHLRYSPKFERKEFVEFYGMSSDTAMEKHHGGVANYRSSEGRTVTIPYKGSANDTVLDLLGGLRSTCTYVGASSLRHLSKCTTFVRVNRQINDVFLK